MDVEEAFACRIQEGTKDSVIPEGTGLEGKPPGADVAMFSIVHIGSHWTPKIWCPCRFCGFVSCLESEEIRQGIKCFK